MAYRKNLQNKLTRLILLCTQKTGTVVHECGVRIKILIKADGRINCDSPCNSKRLTANCQIQWPGNTGRINIKIFFGQDPVSVIYPLNNFTFHFFIFHIKCFSSFNPTQVAYQAPLLFQVSYYQFIRSSVLRVYVYQTRNLT